MNQQDDLREVSAKKIQALFRGFVQRKQYLSLLQQKLIKDDEIQRHKDEMRMEQWALE